MFDWTKYQVLAEELGRRTSDEASLRSAISRAYYAAFCKARNHLLQEGEQIPKTGRAHKIVWDKYRKADQRRQKSIGTTGDRLRRQRGKADYDDTFPDLLSILQSTTTSARQLLEALENIKEDDARASEPSNSLS